MLSLLGFVASVLLEGRAVRARRFFSEALMRCRVGLLGRANELPAELRMQSVCSLAAALPQLPQCPRDLLRAFSTRPFAPGRRLAWALVCVTH
jgi:hypothetical protein